MEIPELTADKWPQTVTRTFKSGATRGSNEKKLDYEGFFAPSVLRCFALYMHEHRKQRDGAVRASDNWQKGMPQEEYIKSLIRHTMDVWSCHRGELIFDVETGLPVSMKESLCGVMFNAMGLLFEVLNGRKL